jgi:hypothetical protein
MLEIVLNFLWTVVIGASVITCAVAAVIVFVTRKLD